MAIRKHKIIPYLVLSALTAMAEPIAARPISIDTHTNIYPIQTDVLLAADSDQIDSIDTARSLPADRWQAAAENSLNLGLANRAWLKFTLRNDGAAPEILYLESATAWIDRLDMYVFQANTLRTHQKNGDLLPADLKPLVYRNPVFEISIDPGATVDVYLDYNSRGTISAPLTIYKSQAFQHQALIEYVLLGTYFGIFVALFLFNISLYFTDKERGFLYYSLYILAIMTYYVIATGLLSHVESFGHGFWMNEFMLVVANAAGIMILLFVRKFFSTRAHMHVLDRFLRFFIGLHLLAFIPAAFFYHYGVMVIYLAGIGSTLCALLAGVIAIRLDLPQSRLYVIAWALFFLGLIVESLASAAVLPSALLARFGLQAGTLLEALIFSMAIGFRVRGLIREKERTQRKLQTVDREMKLARGIQDRIMPEKAPENFRDQVYITYKPLYDIGGDFYDFVAIDRHRLAVAVADVSGHGIAAALDSSTVKIALATAIQSGAEKPDRVLTDMGRFISRHVDFRFVSAVYVLIDFEKSTIQYATAGHPPAILLRKQAMKLIELESDGPLLGIDPTTVYASDTIDFQPGDRLFLYTDGVFESLDERLERNGLELLLNAIINCAQQSPGECQSSILEHIRQARPADDHADDITFLQIVL